MKRLPEAIALHVTCSLRKVGLASALIDVASACAEKVIAPPDVTCCGFAGDKGFSQPELNDHALRHLRESLPDWNAMKAIPPAAPARSASQPIPAGAIGRSCIWSDAASAR